MPAYKSLEYYESYYGCWICTSHHRKKSYGYPRFNRDGKHQSIHRYMYEKYKGKIPEGMLVCHTCDNKRCINPDHLFLGTHSDNIQDAYNKKRRSGFKGEVNPNAKLTIKDIKKIRLSTDLQKDIAKQYNVIQSHVSDIKTRKRWGHI